MRRMMNRTPWIALVATPVAVALGVAAACHHDAPAATPPAAAATPAANFRAISLEEAGIDGAAMDRSVDACTDFYQFACGSWIKSFELPADKSRWVRSFTGIDDRNTTTLRAMLEEAASNPGGDPVKKKIGDYYAACVDEKTVDAVGAAALRPVRDEIAKIRDVKSLGPVLASLHEKGVFAFFDVSSEQDRKDATRVIASVDQNGLGLPDRDYYLKDDERSKSIRDFYAGHVERMFTLLGETPAVAKTAATDVLRIETKLADLSLSRVERREPSNTYHKIDFAGLSEAAKSFPWKAYFTALGHGVFTDINVTSPKYFTGMDALMKSEKPAALQHYLTWQLAHGYARTLSKPFVDENFSLAQKLSGAKELEPRWRRCVRATDGALGELVGRSFVATNFPGESKPVAESMVKGISAAMRAEIGQLPWMDDATRTPAYEKVQKMAFQIGYPDKWREYDLALNRGRYTANAMAASELDFHYDLEHVGKPVDKGRWRMSPPTVNAYYSSGLNEMVFPAGILQPPFFEKSRVSAVNFGAIGTVMGHELTHGFDDKGSQFDGDGNLRDWWSKTTGEQFKSKTACVVKQYGGYEPLPGQPLNGELTTGENIADIGGLKLSWQAWHEARAKEPAEKVVAGGFREDQLFFLSFAQSWCEKMRPEEQANRIKTDPHSPGRFRVTGTLADTPAFAEAFGCKTDGPTCTVW